MYLDHQGIFREYRKLQENASTISYSYDREGVGYDTKAVRYDIERVGYNTGGVGWGTEHHHGRVGVSYREVWSPEDQVAFSATWLLFTVNALLNFIILLSVGDLPILGTRRPKPGNTTDNHFNKTIAWSVLHNHELWGKRSTPEESPPRGGHNYPFRPRGNRQVSSSPSI